MFSVFYLENFFWSSILIHSFLCHLILSQSFRPVQSLLLPQLPQECSFRSVSYSETGLGKKTKTNRISLMCSFLKKLQFLDSDCLESKLGDVGGNRKTRKFTAVSFFQVWISIPSLLAIIYFSKSSHNYIMCSVQRFYV